ncbi:MAG TPA: AAA family ATPase [Solirubrobacteraceae bacterium]
MVSRGRPAFAGAPSRLLERDGELRAVDMAIAASAAGVGALVVVEGPPGAGKTALLNAARERGAAAGVRVLHARGGELEREFSFGVARQLFEPALLEASPSERAQLLDGAAAAAEALVGGSVPPPAVDVAPAAAEALVGGSAPPPAVDVAPSTDAAFLALHGLYWLTANLAATRPLLIVVDDLQWCDAGSLRWLAYLARRIEDLEVVVVAAVHAGDPDAHAQPLVQAIAAARVLRPAPLQRASVALLARDALGGQADDAFCATCHEASGGNPLLVCELLTALADDGVDPRADQAARVPEIGSQAVVRLVRLRLARLRPAAGTLAAAVAILGDRATVDIAAALAELDAEDATAAATQLGQAGLLRAQSPLSFTHPLERAAVYDAIAPLRREAMHAHAARILVADHAAGQHVAAHLLHAPSRHEPFALDVLQSAARAALQHGAVEAAVAYLRRAALEPLPAIARAELLTELGLAERRVDLASAAAHLAEALELIDGAGQRGRVGLQLARVLFLAGRADEAVRVSQETIAGLDGEQRDLRSRLRADLLAMTMLRPELYPIAEGQLAAVAAVGAGGHGEGVGGQMLLAMTAYHGARRGERRDTCADRAELALRDGRLLDEEASSAFVYACRVLVIADRFAAAGAAYERALKRALERGSITSFALGLAFRAGLAIHRGALADAEADARAALDAARVGGVATALPFSLTYLAVALIEQGELEAAAAVLGRFECETDGFADVPYFQLVRGRLRRAQGDVAASLAATLEAAAGYDGTGQSNPALAAWRSEAALAHLALGERAAALELAAEETRLARAWGAPRALGRSLRVAGLAEGGERGVKLIGEALAVLARSPARLERAKTLVELGSAVRRGGERRQARGLLRRGLDLADACGAKPLAERARGELRAAGARPRRPRLTGVQALTPSEQRVAAMAAGGLTNREIAQQLFVTAKTVEVHLSSAYRKLDIRSRTQLADALTRPAAGDRPGAP